MSFSRSENQQLKKVIDRFEGAHADYRATKKGRFNPRRTGIQSGGSSANYHIRSPFEFYNLIEDCYDLERNDAVVGQLLDRRTANVIQDGFRLEPMTGDKSLDNDLKARFNEWAEDPEQCDVSGESCFHEFEIAADWTHILAGDCGMLITESGHLQFFEPYLIRNKFQSYSDDTVHGVKLDNTQRRVAYFIAEETTNPYDVTFNQFQEISTRDALGRRQFFHLYNSKRLALTRGVSAFAPIFELTGMLEDVNFAKLVQQQIVSCIAFLVKQSDSQAAMPQTTGMGDFGHEEEKENASGKSQLYDKLEPGAEVEAPPGKEVTGFSPQIPNPEYFQQYRLILQLICGNLDLPLSVGMMDSSETNFHGFIGAGNEAQKLWRKSQRRNDLKVHTPITIAKFTQFAEEDRHFRNARRRLKRNFYRFKWHKPVWKSVKPLDDTNDRLMRLRNAIISPTKMHAELNTDYESHVEETVRDNSFAIRKAKAEAIKINTDPNLQDGQPIHWSLLYPMPMAEGVQATTQVESEESDPPAKTNGKPQKNGKSRLESILEGVN